MYLITGSILTFSAAIMTLIIGLVYLFRPRFMNYHGHAIQRNWDQLGEEMQILILALMRAVSGGVLSAGIAIIILQTEFVGNRFHWIPPTILIIGSLLVLCSLFAMTLVRTRTKGRPPVVIILLTFFMLILGFVFNVLS
jgi:hypothetical protein